MNAALFPPVSPETMASNDPRAPLGRHLVDAGKLTDEQIDAVLAMQKVNNRRFGETAVAMGLVSEMDLQAALVRQYSYQCLSVGDQVSASVFAVHDPASAQSEALRGLRSQLMMRWLSERQRSVVVTPVGIGESSAVLAANLAVSLAQLSQRVLLVDANLRDPRQHLLFGLDSTVGLSTVLNERCDVESALMAVPSLENLTIMCAGATPPNPQELLNTVVFSYLMETPPRLFDVVVIDTPPAPQFADAHIVSSLAGGCILATRRNRTLLADIETVRQQLQGLSVEIVGAVVLD
jgi:protein-tyrosine kinase